MPADPVVALLPCPHCVGTGKVQQGRGRTSDGNGWLSVVVCQDCGSRGPELLREDAITAWNTRTPAPAGDVREALQAQEDAEDARETCVNCEGEGPWEHCPSCSLTFGWAIDQRRAILSKSEGETAPQEPFGYWVEQKHADPVLLRKPAYIPEPSDLRVITPLYALPSSNHVADAGRLVERLRSYAGTCTGLEPRRILTAAADLLAASPTPDSSAVSGSAEDLREAQEDVAFLLARSGNAGKCMFGGKRWTGISSNALVSIAFGEPDDGLPSDSSDLAACYRAVMRLPAHRRTTAVFDHLEAGERHVEGKYDGSIAWAREASEWPGRAALTEGQQS